NQWLTLGVLLFDKVKEHDDVTDDYTDETHDPEKRHEAERLAHDPQRRQRAHHPKRNRRKHNEWLDRVLELKHQRHEDQQHRDHQYDHQIPKTLDLVFFFATDLQAISGRHFTLQLLEFWTRRLHHFRC